MSFGLPKYFRSQRGFSLIELVAALAVLGIGLPAVAYVFSTALLLDSDSSTRAQAQFLANSLMDEITTRRFRESSANPGNGPETGEVISGSYSRANFDDIDDYDNFSSGNWAYLKPPRDEQGNALTSYPQFEQYVDVFNISNPPTDLSTRSFAEVAAGTTDFKIVTVMILWNNRKSKIVISKVFSLP